MKETRRRPENGSLRILLWGAALSAILAMSLLVTFHWRRDSAPSTIDPYAAVPFRPRVAYDSLDVIISNTEEEPYLDTRLNLYVETVVYSVQIGALHPGETATRSLRAFTNERGESFDPATHRALLLEVRARFSGYDDHKDFPPPE